MLDLVLFGTSEEGEQVLDVRVDSSVGNETEEVEPRSVRGSSLHGVDDCGLLLKLALLDRCESSLYAAKDDITHTGRS